jgi:TRAP-type C4-dicarboxylate transport system permease small subunit
MHTLVSKILRTSILTLVLFFSFQLIPYTTDIVHTVNCNFNDQTDPLGVNCVGGTGLNNEDPRIIIGRIIQVALGLIGIIVVVLIIWAGFRWMTAAGREEEITAAKKTITAAVIGLLIILMAYSITSFVLTELYNVTTGRNVYL